MKPTLASDTDQGFTITELFVVLAIIVVIALLFIRTNPREGRTPVVSCLMNLKQIGVASRMWSDDNSSEYPPQVSTNQGGSLEYVMGGNAFRHFLCMSNELSTPKILVCPADTREPAANFSQLQNENVSYFIGVDANESMPQMFLMGDRNLAINSKAVKPGLVTIKSNDIVSWTAELHDGFGNIAMADGSVQQFTSSGLRQMGSHAGTNVYRLAVP
jgi:prepilin-type N-terminal cleavage/methylation domain-containing protein/prepilin-type processing-associated H-X9-DG protein